MFRSVVILLICIALASCSSRNDELLVACASSMRHVMPELIESYESQYSENDQSRKKITTIFASSGKISTQMEAGAPFDVFISANKSFADRLREKGIVDSLVYITTGQLALVTTGKYKDSVKFQGIDIAIPNSEVAPYGVAADEVVEHTRKYGIWKDVHCIIVPSVAQVNQMLESGAVSAALTAASSQLDIEEHSFRVLDFTKGSELDHYAAIVDVENSEAVKFVQYLNSKMAKSILYSSGYKFEQN